MAILDIVTASRTPPTLSRICRWNGGPANRADRSIPTRGVWSSERFSFLAICFYASPLVASCMPRCFAFTFRLVFFLFFKCFFVSQLRLGVLFSLLQLSVCFLVSLFAYSVSAKHFYSRVCVCFVALSASWCPLCWYGSPPVSRCLFFSLRPPAFFAARVHIFIVFVSVFCFFWPSFARWASFFDVFWSVLGPFSAPGRFFSLLGRPFLSLPKKVPKKGALAHRTTESAHPFWTILASILVPFLVAFSGLKIGLFLDPPGRDFGPKGHPFWTPFWC